MKRKIIVSLSFCLYSIGLSCQTWIHVSVTDSNDKIKSFSINAYETTIGDFDRFVTATGYVTQAEKDGFSTIMGGSKKAGVTWRCNVFGEEVAKESYDTTPVLYLSYGDILAFCKWSKTRLPTESEWEYAFREGKDSKYKYSGSNSGRAVAVNEEFGAVNARDLQVGLKTPNALGIYDMSGNANELCECDEKNVIIRGGSFVDDPSFLTYVRKTPPMLKTGIMNSHTWYVGFRCVKSES